MLLIICHLFIWNKFCDRKLALNPPKKNNNILQKNDKYVLQQLTRTAYVSLMYYVTTNYKGKFWWNVSFFKQFVGNPGNKIATLTTNCCNLSNYCLVTTRTLSTIIWYDNWRTTFCERQFVIRKLCVHGHNLMIFTGYN